MTKPIFLKLPIVSFIVLIVAVSGVYAWVFWRDMKIVSIENEGVDVHKGIPVSTKSSQPLQLPVPVLTVGGSGGGDGGGFACGPDTVCNRTTQYCSVLFGGPRGVPPSYACVDLPDGLPSPPTCESIPVAIGCECIESGGGITVTCTAP
jgi:hypothetical protein